jgi:hypothetical protein
MEKVENQETTTVVEKPVKVIEEPKEPVKVIEEPKEPVKVMEEPEKPKEPPIKLFIPVIAYNHTCHTAYMFSLMKLVLALKERNINVTLFNIGFDSLVCRARNAAVAYFMSQEDNTHLLFLDADIEFKVEDILKLIEAKESVIGAAYSQKWLNLDKMKAVFKQESIPENPLQLCTNHSVHIKEPVNQSQSKLEVSYLTTGCMLINRSAIETLIRCYPERKFTNDIDGYSTANKDLFYNFFSVEINIETKRYESEDYCFCRLYTQKQGKVYVIPDIVLTHYGWFGFQCDMTKSI